MKKLERRPPHCLTGCPNFATGKCLCRSIIPEKSCPFAFPFVSMAVSRLAFPTLMVPSLFMFRHSVKSLTAYWAMSKSTFLQWVVKIEAHVNFPERYSFFSSRSLLVSRVFSEGNGLTFNRDELLGWKSWGKNGSPLFGHKRQFKWEIPISFLVSHSLFPSTHLKLTKQTKKV